MTDEPIVINPPTDPQTPPVENPQNPPVILTLSDADLLKTPAVLALVETVRKQEKDKLYKTIEDKDKELKTLSGRIAGLENQVEGKESAKMEELSELKGTITLLQQQQADLLKELSDQKVKAERDKADADAKHAEAELKAYKEAKLREAGDELILELVSGNTQEEIDASIEFSKQKFEEIANKVTEKKGTSKAEKLNNTPRITNPPSSSVQPLTVDQVQKMSHEEFAKNRAAILEAARKGLIQ